MSHYTGDRRDPFDPRCHKCQEFSDECTCKGAAMSERPTQNEIDEAAKATGFRMCEFPPDADPCEKCGRPNQQHYWRGTDAFSQDGEYYCADCIVTEHKQNIADEANASHAQYVEEAEVLALAKECGIEYRNLGVRPECDGMLYVGTITSVFEFASKLRAKDAAIIASLKA